MPYFDYGEFLHTQEDTLPDSVLFRRIKWSMVCAQLSCWLCPFPFALPS
jgi:hypothetical protein